MIVVQRDYINCGRSSGTQSKLPDNKKKCSSLSILKMMITLMVAVLVICIRYLYFISHDKSDKIVIAPSCTQNNNNELPPKPEERWHYIKELENRHIRIQSFIEPATGRELNSLTQSTNKQHQTLERMQVYMRCESIYLNEVPYRDNQKEVAVRTR